MEVNDKLCVHLRHCAGRILSRKYKPMKATERLFNLLYFRPEIS